MKVCRNPDVVDTILDNEICLFVASKAEYFNLNSTASFIWKILDKPCSPEFIISKIIETYNTSKSTCTKEVNIFIEQAIKNEILINIK